ncbi:hypothetical protein skT53_17570 [Effusibacillus dendaii]|uniref:Uncharacterized protein n=1 Tax=Effusibacillus dendaii TaxID=2743772 RepID=A0A7I8DBP1_9BACL|nr:hypothetical protein skT53_17570 [Effusibacillus dendaii]
MKFLFEAAAIYGFDVKKYEERIFILHVFQLAFSSDAHRQHTLEIIKNWEERKEQLKQLDWRVFQQESFVRQEGLSLEIDSIPPSFSYNVAMMIPSLQLPFPKNMQLHTKEQVKLLFPMPHHLMPHLIKQTCSILAGETVRDAGF